MTVDEGTLSVRQTVVGVIRHRWKLITAFALLGVVGALVYSLSQPTRYTASVEFVVGGQDFSSVLAISLDPRHTGPLTLDLPAETQARVMISSTISDRVLAQLNLSRADASSLASSARSRALTDNAYSITVDGPTAEQAALYANDFAAAYFSYRQDNTRKLLADLVTQYRADADSATTQAAALDAAIKSASTRNSGDVSALRTSQQQLLATARDQNNVADQLEATAKNYHGGGSVTAPATASDATRSPLILRDTVFGLLLALLIGLVVAVIAEKASDRLYTREEIARAAQAPILLSLPVARRHGWREEYERQAELAVTTLGDDAALGAGGRLVVRPILKSESAALVAVALGEALERSHGRCLVQGFDDRAAPDVAAAQRVWYVDTTEPTSIQASTRLEKKAAAPLSVELTVPHYSDGGPSVWPPAGTLVVLVVTAQHDRTPDVRRAADELSMAGIRVVGVAVVDIDPTDATTGWSGAATAESRA
jgi:capsular polysaccharide biosynthesis protein